MRLLDLLAYFAGGMTLLNALPHLAAGMMGRRFPSPFARPPGKGLSSATANVFWGFGNLVIAYLLVCRVGRFDLRDPAHATALGLGMVLIGLVCARHFGGLNEGRGPDPA